MDRFITGLNRPVVFAASFALFYSVVMACLAIYTRPLFPVDETRYASVAWEMFSQNQWVLPTLNFEPYSHKPPLLFWITMGLWHVVGVTEKVPLAIPFLFAFITTILTGRLASSLFPARSTLPAHTMLVLMGALVFAVYSNMLMFDILLSIFAISGLYAGWKWCQTGQWRWVAFLGLAIGFGVLAKGPVILLHVFVPMIVFYIWSAIVKDNTLPHVLKFHSGLVLAVCIGAAISLSWAIPAAQLGGAEFQEKIFVGQTTGRMVESFDHARPVWWYLAISPIFVFPWLAWPPAWRGISALFQTHADAKDRQALRFLMSWILPVFIAFSFISGKQPHYLIPLLPGLAILIAYSLQNITSIKRYDGPVIATILLILATLPLVLANLPETLPNLSLWKDQPNLHKVFLDISRTGAAVILILVAICSVWAARTKTVTVHIAAITASIAIMMGGFLFEGRNNAFLKYDLKPLARIIESNPGRPLAFIRNYHGEFSFLARLDRPIKQLEPHELDLWFQKNPNGIAIRREDSDKDMGDYDIVYQQDYKMTKIYAVIVPRGKSGSVLLNP